MNGTEASARRARRNVVLTAAIAGLGGLLFGYEERAGVMAATPAPPGSVEPVG